MIKKTLAGLVLGCVLATPAAFAEEYRGFYFGLWGGAGSIDFMSKSSYDTIITGNLADEVASIPIVGSTNLTVDSLGGSSLDDSLSTWGAQVGFRFNKYVAAEVGYVNLGELLYTLDGNISGDYVQLADDGTTTTTTALDGGFERSTQFTSAGPTLSVLGMYPLGTKFDVHVRGGIYFADSRLTDRLRYVGSGGDGESFNLLHRRVDASENELFLGLGGAWNINASFTLRLEYQKFLDVGGDGKTGESDIDVINVAVLFK